MSNRRNHATCIMLVPYIVLIAGCSDPTSPVVDAVVNGRGTDEFPLPLIPEEPGPSRRRYLGNRVNYLAPGAVLHPGVIELAGVELFDDDLGPVHLSVFFEDGYLVMDPVLNIGFTIIEYNLKRSGF
jgi:hypothetical protein